MNNNQEIFDPRTFISSSKDFRTGLGAMTNVHELFWAEKKIVRFWFRMMIVMFICQLSAVVYNLTLPRDQWLWLPFFCCVILAAIGGRFPQRRRQKHLDKMEEINKKLQDEYDQMVTGEAKQ